LLLECHPLYHYIALRAVKFVKKILLPVCFNALPGIWPDPLFQNRVICILPPFGYVTADRHTWMKLPEISIRRNKLMGLHMQLVSLVTSKSLISLHMQLVSLVTSKSSISLHMQLVSLVTSKHSISFNMHLVSLVTSISSISLHMQLVSLVTSKSFS
jgi:hypothetical protein